jgi:hypothetical protein
MCAEQWSLVSVTDGLPPGVTVKDVCLMEQLSTAALCSRVAESRIFRQSVSVGGVQHFWYSWYRGSSHGIWGWGGGVDMCDHASFFTPFVSICNA